MKKQSPKRNFPAWVLTALGLGFIVLCFRPGLDAPFISMDDPQCITGNPAVRGLDPAHLRQIFTTPVTHVYVPLTMLSFALEYHFFQGQPFFYHLDNLLLHLVNVLLVIALARRMRIPRGGALLAGALFGLHPMHVEPVVWATARKDVLYSLFFLLALIQYHDGFLSTGSPGGKSPSRPKTKTTAYLLTGLWTLLSVLAKPMALSLPLCLILLDWYHRRLSWKTTAAKLPFFLLVIPVAWITYAQNQRVPVTDFAQGALIWIWTFTFYLKKFIWPSFFSLIYALPSPVSLANPSYSGSVLLFAGLPALMIVLRRSRLFIFSILFYAVSVFYLCRFDEAVDITIVADRYMYLPSLGFCLLAGALAVKAVRRLSDGGRTAAAKGLTAAVLLAVIGFGILTFRQGRLWTDETALWSQAIRHTPEAFYAYRNRGWLYFQKGDYDKAVEDYNRAVAINPEFEQAYFNRGVLMAKLKKWDEALDDYTRAIELNPGYADPYNNRAIVYQKKGDLALALDDLNRFLVLRPGQPFAHFNRGLIHLKQNHPAGALADFNVFIEAYPLKADGYIQRAKAHLQSGQPNQARRDLQTALKLNPDNRRARKLLNKVSR